MNNFGDIILCVAMAFDQLLVTFGLLDRVEVFALNIFDQRQLRGRRFVNLPHNRRYGVQPRPLRCAPTALPGDDLETLSVAVRPQKDWLEDTALGDRIGELVDGLVTE